MGMVKIQIVGSFIQHQNKEFSALKRGHASAIADAIKFLAEDALPKAIKQDVELAKDGATPENGFGGID